MLQSRGLRRKLRLVGPECPNHAHLSANFRRLPAIVIENEHPRLPLAGARYRYDQSAQVGEVTQVEYLARRVAVPSWP
jgi:hypothetical protein